MPQMKVERKFFSVRVEKSRQIITLTNSQKLAVVKLQEFKEFRKNITGGEE